MSRGSVQGRTRARQTTRSRNRRRAGRRAERNLPGGGFGRQSLHRFVSLRFQPGGQKATLAAVRYRDDDLLAERQCAATFSIVHASDYCARGRRRPCWCSCESHETVSAVQFFACRAFALPAAGRRAHAGSHRPRDGRMNAHWLECAPQVVQRGAEIRTSILWAAERPPRVGREANHDGRFGLREPAPDLRLNHGDDTRQLTARRGGVPRPDGPDQRQHHRARLREVERHRDRERSRRCVAPRRRVTSIAGSSRRSKTSTRTPASRRSAALHRPGPVPMP